MKLTFELFISLIITLIYKYTQGKYYNIVSNDKFYQFLTKEFLNR